MKANVYNLKNEVLREINLPENIFGAKWNADVVHQAVVAEDANARVTIAHTKGRGEVSGGGKKPWKQKHTGRARHGSIRSPIWKGGGVTHGPNKNKDYSKKLPKKMARMALHAALSKRFSMNAVKVIDSAVIEPPKTNSFAKALQTLQGGKVHALIIANKDNKLVNRISRNIPRVKSLSAGALNVKDIMTYSAIFIEEKALAQIK